VGSNHLDARFGISPATAASLVWPEGRDHAPDESNVGERTASVRSAQSLLGVSPLIAGA